MTWTVLVSGFTLGAIGSLHCIGMCGPLSMALPVQHLSGSRRFLSLLFYQLGRIVTYSFFGALLGMVGRGLYLAGYQQWFSITAGAIILLIAVLYFLQKRFITLPVFQKSNPVSKLIGYLLRKARTPSGFLLFGMANGLLPCGMVYIALLTTLSFTNVVQSVGFMAMFGLGTAPAMMIAAYAIQKLKWRNRLAIRQLVPYIITVTGILLILRGMNLGIPFISPELPGHADKVISCHS